MTTMHTLDPDSVSAEVGITIQSLMFRKRLSQRKVAAVLGIGQSTVSQKLRGTTGISIADLYKIAQLLDVEPVELLPRLDSNQQPAGYTSPQVSGLVVDLSAYRQGRLVSELTTNYRVG